jgi:hypothetical protein
MSISDRFFPKFFFRGISFILLMIIKKWVGERKYFFHQKKINIVNIFLKKIF